MGIGYPPAKSIIITYILHIKKPHKKGSSVKYVNACRVERIALTHGNIWFQTDNILKSV